MWCIWNGKVCLQLWDKKREKWVYIPFRKWVKMNDKQKNRYILDGIGGI